MSNAIHATLAFLAMALAFSFVVNRINDDSLKRAWWMLGAFLFGMAMLFMSFIVMFASWWKAFK